MRAVCLEGPRRAGVCEVADPTPEPGDVLVRVRACGLCGSDLNAWRGVPGIDYPMPGGAPGHEVWGDVAALGPEVQGLAVGQLVTGVMFNGLAELALARADELLDVPAALGGAPLLGEPLACAANVVRRSAVDADQPVAIVGFGYLAALVVQLLFAERPGSWIAVARREDSRALARELGAEATYSFEDVPPHLWDSFPVVIEAAGVQRTLDYATWLAAYRGRLVIAGYHADGPRSVNLQSWNWKGLDVINAHERDPRMYVQGLRDGLAAVLRYRLDLARLISHSWPLAAVAEAFAVLEARPPGFVKGIIRP